MLGEVRLCYSVNEVISVRSCLDCRFHLFVRSFVHSFIHLLSSSSKSYKVCCLYHKAIEVENSEMLIVSAIGHKPGKEGKDGDGNPEAISCRECRGQHWAL